MTKAEKCFLKIKNPKKNVDFTEKECSVPYQAVVMKLQDTFNFISYFPNTIYLQCDLLRWLYLLSNVFCAGAS